MKSDKIISIDEDIVEIKLSNDGIKDLMNNLIELQKNFRHIHFKLNNGELLIHYENDELK